MVQNTLKYLVYIFRYREHTTRKADLKFSLEHHFFRMRGLAPKIALLLRGICNISNAVTDTLDSALEHFDKKPRFHFSTRERPGFRTIAYFW